MYAKVLQKENGFMVQTFDDDVALTKEIVVEGKDQKKIGAAILTAFAKPRAYKKRAEKTA